MKMSTFTHNFFLDGYILNKQFSLLAFISSNAYRYWSHVDAGKYEGSRVVFLKKDTILSKYSNIVEKCTDLSGMVQSQSFCKYTGLAPSHLIEKNGSCIYKYLDILEVEDIKFVNLKKFYDDLSLDYHQNIYIEKCKYFAPAPLEKKIKITDGMCVGYY
ncbi:MAG: cysteine permease [Sulfurospirillaceae bacterium]|nr:cysteine permease [Sulfurospirillaceae bacterium]